MFKNYLKSSWRNVLRRKGFSLLNVGGLALGIASCLMLLLYVNYHLTFDKQFNNIKNIYMVENNQPGDGKTYTFASTPRLLSVNIKAEVPGVVQTTRVLKYAADGLLTYNQNSFKKKGLFTDQPFFSIFSYHFIRGSAENALREPNSIVITKDLAQTIFGNEDPMNKVIARNNSLPLKVTGVIENPPVNSSYQFDYVMPWQIFEDTVPWAKNASWGSNFANTIVQLKEGANLARVNALVKPIIIRHHSDSKAELFLFPFADQHLYSSFENGKSAGGMIEQIHLFEILAFCILLVACVNFMNLSTARSEERAKEVGIRKAIGSGVKSLIIQFLTESLILSITSTIVAVLILLACIPFFNNLLNIKMFFPYREWFTWAVIISLAFITGLVSGSYPAFYLSSFQPIKVLKGVFKGGNNALPIRKVLVVVQFAFAVFLITATICIYRQIRFVQNKPNGYDKNNLVEIPVEGTLGKVSDVFINQLKASGVINAATSVSQGITSNGTNTSNFSWEGKRPDEQILFDLFDAGYEFTKTTGVKLLAGREFSTQFPGDTSGNTVMINETAAKVMGLKNTIGAVIKFGDGPRTIVGVYKDFVWGSPYEKTPPMITGFVAGGNAKALALRLNPAKSILSSMDEINKALKAINPAYPPTVHFVDEEYQEKFDNERVLAILANIFGGLAIVISCLGLFGLAAHAAEQRIKEIGVRKVLGASVTNLAALLSKDFLKLVTIAIIIAIPCSVWALNKWLQKYEFHVNVSWWIIALASVITIAIAIITVSFQAIKAALANPIQSLRSE